MLYTNFVPASEYLQRLHVIGLALLQQEDDGLRRSLHPKPAPSLPSFGLWQMHPTLICCLHAKHKHKVDQPPSYIAPSMNSSNMEVQDFQLQGLGEQKSSFICTVPLNQITEENT